jgi:hypothetical protein
MDKGMGFSRRVLLDWLDVTASLCLENMDQPTIRKHLQETISGTVNGQESQRKTIDVLVAIWIKTANIAPQIHKDALILYPALTSSEERVWLHYGLSLVCYQFFRKCVLTIGQVSRIENFITRGLIKDRVSADYGHLGGLDRSVERLAASLTDWGVLAKTDEKQKYRIQSKQFSSPEFIQSWLLACTLFAHPSDALPVDDLLHSPDLFPFVITLTSHGIREDKRFEIQRQGGGLEMVRLRENT